MNDLHTSQLYSPWRSRIYFLHYVYFLYIIGWSTCILEKLGDCSLCRPSMTIKWKCDLISKRWWDSRGTEAMRWQFSTKDHQMDTFATKGTRDVMVIWKWGLIGKKTLGLVAKCLAWVATKNGKKYLDRILRVSIINTFVSHVNAYQRVSSSEEAP